MGKLFAAAKQGEEVAHGPSIEALSLSASEKSKRDPDLGLRPNFCPVRCDYVYDRGCDRKELLTPHLRADRQFIVRQRGTRHLFYKGKKHPFAFLTCKTKLRWAFRVERVYHNKVHQLTFDCGVVPVQLTATDQQLWLIE